MGQQWKISEFIALKKYFPEITIIPHEHHLAGQEAICEFMGIMVTPPLFTKQVYLEPWKIFHLLSPRFFIYLQEFLSKKVFLSKRKMVSFFMTTYKIEKMFQNETIKEIIEKKDKNKIVLYFYWGAGSSIIIPFLKGFKNITVRFHGYDLYEDRNAGYIPFRSQLLKKLSNAIFISEHGMNYLNRKYKGIEKKSRLFRIGTVSKGDALPGGDSVLRIMSCSSVKELKRVSLILRAIKKMDIPVAWTHIGGGELFEELKREAEKMPAHIKVNLPGHIESDQVLDFYVNKNADVFVNVSSTEGVPVSVMEALSASIPVIATDVGGTGEIVDETVGMLIPAIINEDDLANYLLKFYYIPGVKKMELRANAKRRYEESCNADVLNEKFAKFLNS